MADRQLTANLTVAELLECWPEAVAVFQELKTACVGCVMAPFDTLEDVAQIYGLDLSKIMVALEKQIGPAAEPTASQAARPNLAE